MPFARVGAMPPPSRNDGKQSTEQNGAARNNRQKGITMEDLKKQTAIRLAQEQQQQGLTGSHQSSNAAASQVQQPVPMAASQTGHLQYVNRTQHNGSTGFTAVNRDPAPHHAPRKSAPINSGSGRHLNTGRYHDQSVVSKNARKNSRMTKASVSASAPGTTQKVSAFAPRYKQEQQHARSVTGATVPVNPLSATASTSFDATPHQGTQQSTATSKLPHGLTVHELKEMTKARLQAEAAEKPPSINPNKVPRALPPERDAPEPRGGEVTADTRRSRFSQQQTSSAEFHHRPSSSTSSRSGIAVPSLVQVQSQSTEQTQGGRQPPQVSPLPPGFQTYRPTLSSFNENSSQDQNRTGVNINRESFHSDSNWETASVTSHNSTVASDYLGSESAFSSGVSAFVSHASDDVSGMPLGRTQSYPLGNGRSLGAAELSSYENAPTALQSPLGSYFDTTIGTAQNRQRAMTLSPRPGLSLLHEDRPGFCGNELGMPSFSSAPRRQQLSARSLRSYSPVMQGQTFSSDNFGGFGNGFAGVIGGGLETANRPRTSSAVSLPAISHTDEEFALDLNGSASSRRSSGSNHVGGIPIRDDFSSSLADSMLGSSSLYSGDAGTSGASSVFRDNSSIGLGNVAPPPGLLNGNESMVNSARVRAASWVAGCDVFGTSTGLMQCSGDDTLAGDLASILKLSGAEEKPDSNNRSDILPGLSSSVLGSSNSFAQNGPSSQHF